MRDLLLRFLRVPPSPDPPPGSPPKTFRAADNFFALLLVRQIVFQLALLMIPIGITVALRTLAIEEPRFATLGTAIITIVWVVFAIHFVVALAITRLDFELRWYMLSDRAIRVREGILTIDEKTIALANIQNIEIRQGPLQRLLSIADIEVKTAGGGGATGGRKQEMLKPLHTAYFRGVADAESIRDLLRDGIRRYRDAGLGDPEETASGAVRPVSEAILSELLREAIELRRTAERSVP